MSHPDIARVDLSRLPTWTSGRGIRKIIDGEEVWIMYGESFLERFPPKPLNALQTLKLIMQISRGEHPRILLDGRDPTGGCANFTGRDPVTNRFCGCIVGVLWASLGPEMEVILEKSAPWNGCTGISFMHNNVENIFGIPREFQEDIQKEHDDSTNENHSGFVGSSQTAATVVGFLVSSLMKSQLVKIGNRYWKFQGLELVSDPLPGASR